MVGQLADTEKVGGEVFEQADKCSSDLSAKKLRKSVAINLKKLRKPVNIF